jgi:uncharacterized protein YbbC (DUF1343 family)
LRVTDRLTYDPVRTGVAVLLETRAMSGENWEWNVRHVDRLAGSDALRLAVDAGVELAEIVDTWNPGLAEFERLRDRYLLYPETATDR